MKTTCLTALALVVASSACAIALSQPNFWQPMNNGLTNLNVGALAVGSNGVLYSAAGASVFRSTDNGNSWDSVGQTGGSFISSLEVNSLGHLFAAGAFSGVYRSTNNGASWIPVNSGLTNPNVLALAIKSSGEIFVGLLPVGIGMGFYYGIYRSTDNGDSWVEVNTGIRDSTGIESFGINTGGDIFAGGSDGRGIYRSTNNGNNWTQLINGLPASLSVTAIAASPNGHVFAGASSPDTIIYRSTDNGSTWTSVYVAPPLVTPTVRSLVINGLGHIFAAIAQSTFGYGILRSTDDGTSWTMINSGLPPMTNVGDLVINSPGFVFAGAYGAGVFRSVESTTSVEQDGGEIPFSYSLEQNYPNPFNPSTSIRFRIVDYGFVSLTIYDLLGRDVATLVNEELQPGSYEVEWHAKGRASGVYFYRLQAGNFSATKKLLLLR